MLLKKLIVILVFSIFAVSPVFAITKTQVQQKNLVMKMYSYIQSLQSKKMKIDDFKKFYTPNVEMITNSVLLAKGYQEFYKHFELVIKMYPQFHFVFPIGKVLQDGNHVIVHYAIKVNTHSMTGALYVIAIMTFKDGKINTWNEVVGMPLEKQ